MSEWVDIKEGDRVVLTAKGNRYEVTADTNDGDGAGFYDTYGFWFNPKVFVLESITRPAPAEPTTLGSIIRFEDRVNGRVHVGLRGDESKSFPWEITGDGDIFSWASILDIAKPGSIEVIQ